MRTQLLRGMLVILALSGCKYSTPSIPERKQLSDGCAIASLLALKAIQGDPLVPEPHSGLVSRSTQEKIDAADVAAVSREERRVAGARARRNNKRSQRFRDGLEWLFPRLR